MLRNPTYEDTTPKCLGALILSTAQLRRHAIVSLLSMRVATLFRPRHAIALQKLEHSISVEEDTPKVKIVYKHS